MALFFKVEQMKTRGSIPLNVLILTKQQLFIIALSLLKLSTRKNLSGGTTWLDIS